MYRILEIPFNYYKNEHMQRIEPVENPLVELAAAAASFTVVVFQKKRRYEYAYDPHCKIIQQLYAMNCFFLSP